MADEEMLMLCTLMYLTISVATCAMERREKGLIILLAEMCHPQQPFMVNKYLGLALFQVLVLFRVCFCMAL